MLPYIGIGTSLALCNVFFNLLLRQDQIDFAIGCQAVHIRFDTRQQ